MPTYDYRCTACKHEFEQFQTMSAKLLRTCPACGKAKLERLIGIGAAVLFKGSGFYQTDYRSEGYKKSAEAESKPASDAKPTATTTPESGKSDSSSKPEPAPTASATDSKPSKPPEAKVEASSSSKKPAATPKPRARRRS